MKHTFLLSVTAIVITIGISGCNSTNREPKVQEAKENLDEARKELQEARQDSADFELFKGESASRIKHNEEIIADYRLELRKSKRKSKAMIQEKLNILEQKNENMRKQINEFKENGKDYRNSFRTEFNHDMDELGNALKDLTVNNVK